MKKDFWLIGLWVSLLLKVFNMLILLNDNIINALSNTSLCDYDKEVIAINDLARSCFEHHHILIASYDVLKFLMSYNLCYSLSKRLFHKLFNTISFTYNYKSCVNNYIEIDAFATNISFNSKEQKWILPLKDSYSITPSTLIVENTLDFDFYSNMILKYSKTINKFRFSINLSSLHLGGSNSNGTIERYALKNKILLSITDSDKYHSRSNLGATAKSVNESFKKLDRNIRHNHVLNVRELENILPVESYNIFFENLPNKSIYEFISNHSNIHIKNFIVYGDLKGGPRLKEYRNTSNKYGNHTKDFIDLIITNGVISNKQIDTSRNDDDVIFNGVASNFKKIVNEYFIKEYMDELEKKLSNNRISQNQFNTEKTKYLKFVKIIEKLLNEITIKDLCSKIIDFGICFEKEFNIV